MVIFWHKVNYSIKSDHYERLWHGTCPNCGQMVHSNKNCPAIGHRCEKCNEIDHFENRCSTNIQNNQLENNEFGNNEENSDGEISLSDLSEEEIKVNGHAEKQQKTVNYFDYSSEQQTSSSRSSTPVSNSKYSTSCSKSPRPISRFSDFQVSPLEDDGSDLRKLLKSRKHVKNLKKYKRQEVKFDAGDLTKKRKLVLSSTDLPKNVSRNTRNKCQEREKYQENIKSSSQFCQNLGEKPSEIFITEKQGSMDKQSADLMTKDIELLRKMNLIKQLRLENDKLERDYSDKCKENEKLLKKLNSEKLKSRKEKIQDLEKRYETKIGKLTYKCDVYQMQVSNLESKVANLERLTNDYREKFMSENSTDNCLKCQKNQRESNLINDSNINLDRNLFAKKRVEELQNQISAIETSFSEPNDSKIDAKFIKVEQIDENPENNSTEISKLQEEVYEKVNENLKVVSENVRLNHQVESLLSEVIRLKNKLKENT